MDTCFLKVARRLPRDSFLWLACCVAAAGSTAAAGESDRVMVDYLNRVRAETAAQSISVAILHRGEIAFNRAVGFADLERSIKATPETVYRTGSIAKVITVVAVMRSIEAGELSLGTNVRELVPEFREKKGDITIEHLLTHTSGIRHYSGWDYIPGGKLRREYASAADALRIFAEDNLLFEPGTGFRYSTYAFTLLQVALERATRSDFESYLREHIWRPAGMSHTSLERKDSEFAVGYSRPNKYTSGFGAKNRKGHFEPEPQHGVSYKHAGGGMLSTPEDLVKFADAVHGGKLLSQNSTTTMLQKKYHRLEGSGNTAFAWRVDEQDGQPMIHMGGSIVGFKSFLVSWPAEELSIAVMVNQSDFPRREEIAFHLARIYRENNKPNPPNPPSPE